MNPMIPLRRALGVAVVAALAWGCGGSGQPSALPPAGSLDPAGLAVTMQPFLDGFDSPLAAVNAGDGSGRLFVVEQGGRIRIVRDGQLLPDAVPRRLGRDQERRRAGPPRPRVPPGLPEGPALLRRLHRHERRHARRVVHGRSLEPRPGRPGVRAATALRRRSPTRTTTAARSRSGPTATCTSRWATAAAAATRTATARSSTTLLGKILRIDVEAAGATACTRSRPTTRSSSTSGAEPEIWLYGLRNPWRFSFDRATGDLWIGDVGQGAWEEVDVARAGTSGGTNYGWNRMEATHCYRPERGLRRERPDDARGRVLPQRRLHGHRRLRLPRLGQPALAGKYLFGDYCSGTIWAIDPTRNGLREPTVVGPHGRIAQLVRRGRGGRAVRHRPVGRPAPQGQRVARLRVSATRVRNDGAPA